MHAFDYGNPQASHVLVQMVDDHDLAALEQEIAALRARTEVDFYLRAVKVARWNNDLSPWEAPPVFRKEGFAGNAASTLAEVLALIEESGRTAEGGAASDDEKTYIIGGYSLAGLFALWAVYQTDVFKGVAAASPSLWFPDFTDYMKAQRIKAQAAYLSLGDKEERTRNAVMATVGVKVREAYATLCDREVACTLEWNAGNHFKEADIRTAKAFAWVLNTLR